MPITIENVSNQNNIPAKSKLSERGMVVHVDYSKNYKNKQRNEIKEAYYGQNTFSIMPTHPEQAGVTRILKSSPTCQSSYLFTRISALPNMSISMNSESENFSL